MIRSFAPVVGKRPAVLILGSMPGAASLRLGQYYGHPQNLFWRLLGDVLREDLKGRAYRARLATLRRRRVALWDTLESCRRQGSLDSSVRDETHNAVAKLILRYPTIKAIFFNGRKAQAAFMKCSGEGIARLTGIALHHLPSSSPANASVGYADKLKRWKLVARYLNGIRPKSSRYLDPGHDKAAQ